MALTTKVVQFGCNNTRTLSSTAGYTKTVFKTSGGAQNNMLDLQGIDREMVDVKYTANWNRMDNNSSVKEDIKLLTREEMARAKQEKRSTITTAWKQFE
jgi:hypothetical protein